MFHTTALNPLHLCAAFMLMNVYQDGPPAPTFEHILHICIPYYLYVKSQPSTTQHKSFDIGYMILDTSSMMYDTSYSCYSPWLCLVSVSICARVR